MSACRSGQEPFVIGPADVNADEDGVLARINVISEYNKNIK